MNSFASLARQFCVQLVLTSLVSNFAIQLWFLPLIVFFPGAFAGLFGSLGANEGPLQGDLIQLWFAAGGWLVAGALMKTSVTWRVFFPLVLKAIVLVPFSVPLVLARR